MNSFTYIWNYKHETMRKNTSLLILILLIAGLQGCKEKKISRLVPGYDKTELARLLPVMERTYDSADIGGFRTPSPEGFRRIFRSRTSPLLNRFDIWQGDDQRAVIAIRGTIYDTAALNFSLAFYALMVPAEGRIKMSDTSWFQYKLAELPGAGVHLGVIIALYYLSPEMLQQIRLLYSQGTRDFYILGHSQGSGIGYVVTSWLRYLQKDNKLPSDIQFKTYNIAAPKAGNLRYAQDYENLNSPGYAFSVNNILDWVPSIPLSFQLPGDFPKISPFNDLKGFLTLLSFKPGADFNTKSAAFFKTGTSVVEEMEKVIHEQIYPRIAKQMPGYAEPASMHSFDYERIGTNIPLIPNQEYYKLFPNDPAKSQVWENHSVYPYYLLVTKPD